METSLRLGGNPKGLRIHAKEKLPLLSTSLLQAHGEMDTSTGAPSYLAMFLRQFYPQLSANIGVGIQLGEGDDFNYNLRGKKAFPFTPSGLVGINIKGRLITDKDFKPRKKIGAVELAWSILDIRKDQDVRLKVGYVFYQKVPYFQLRENNWTFNAYMNEVWSQYLKLLSDHPQLVALLSRLAIGMPREQEKERPTQIVLYEDRKPWRKNILSSESHCGGRPVSRHKGSFSILELDGSY